MTSQVHPSHPDRPGRRLDVVTVLVSTLVAAALVAELVMIFSLS
jgi:hypothetical protein